MRWTPKFPRLPGGPSCRRVPPPTSLPVLVLKPKACVSCRARKVKCDRGTPCTNCTRWSLQCVFPSPVRKCRRVRKAAKAPTTSEAGLRNEGVSAEVAQQLDETLQSLSTLIDKHKEVLDSNRDSIQLRHSEWNSPVDAGSFETLQASVEKVAELMSTGVNGVASADTYVPSLFTRLSSTLGKLQSHSPQPFPISNFRLDVAPFHPSPPQVQRSWHTFLLNIDPLVEILHRSTAERISAQSRPRSNFSHQWRDCRRLHRLLLLPLGHVRRRSGILFQYTKTSSSGCIQGRGRARSNTDRSFDGERPDDSPGICSLPLLGALHRRRHEDMGSHWVGATP